MDDIYLNSLAYQGTPESRNEKSSYLQRSLGRNSASTSQAQTPNIRDVSSIYPSPRIEISLEPILNYETTYALSGIQESRFLALDVEDNSKIEFNTENGSLAIDLYQEFLDLYTSYPGEHEVFELLLRNEELCDKTAEELKPVLHKAAPMRQKHAIINSVIQELRLERNTWRLARTLYEDRLEHCTTNEEEMLLDTLGKRMSDKQLIENFFARNSSVRQSQLVVDWLEKNASDDFNDEYKEKLQYFTEQSTISWEHTLHDLKTKTPMIRPTQDSLITELDPDAPIRQRHNILHSEDREIESRLLKVMFLYLRCGNLDEAQRTAENFGYPWLAAALEGWRPFHDPNYDSESLTEGEPLQPVEGNKYRDIWKAACWRMSQEPKISAYQQALFGCLSGNLRAITPVCLNWYDYLWAYSRVLVDKLTEQELRSNTQNTRLLEELPADYWDRIPDFEQIFHELHAIEAIRVEGQSYHAVIQKYIILDDIDGLLETMHGWLRRKEPPLSGHLLRIMSHLVLFFRTIGRSTKEEHCVSILEAYVEELISQSKMSLVAPYVATLPSSHQVTWYAKFLEGITDMKERELCLKYAEDAGLDIPSITKTVVTNVRNKVPDSIDPTSNFTRAVTTEEDEQKISALGWLFFNPTQRAEALKQANALMRIFVACEKLDAARAVMSKIPDDSVSVITERLNEEDDLSPEEDNTIKEYMCFKAYLEAFDAFNDWFEVYQHGRPPHPPPIKKNASFKETIAHEHIMQEYELELMRWENALMAQTKITTSQLYNVLLFVGGGWMVDQRESIPVDESRQKQMSMLRKLCIPQVTKLLHNVFYNTQQYKESIQLADIIAAESNKLYKEFSTQELQDLLTLFKDSSLCLLREEGKDHLGYPESGHPD